MSPAEYTPAEVVDMDESSGGTAALPLLLIPERAELWYDVAVEKDDSLLPVASPLQLL